MLHDVITRFFILGHITAWGDVATPSTSSNPHHILLHMIYLYIHKPKL